MRVAAVVLLALLAAGCARARAGDPTAVCAEQLGRMTIPSTFDSVSGHVGQDRDYWEVTVTSGGHTFGATCSYRGPGPGSFGASGGWWLLTTQSGPAPPARTYVFAAERWMTGEEIAAMRSAPEGQGPTAGGKPTR